MDFITDNIFWIAGILVFLVFFGIGFFADKRQQKHQKLAEEKLLNYDEFDKTIDIKKELEKENGILKYSDSITKNVVSNEQIGNVEFEQTQQVENNVLLNAISKANSLLSESQINNMIQYAPTNTTPSNVNVLKETVENNIVNIPNNSIAPNDVEILNAGHQVLNHDNNVKREKLLSNINDLKENAAVLENELYNAKQNLASGNFDSINLIEEMEHLDQDIEEILSVTEDFTNLFQNNSQIQTARVEFNEGSFNNKFTKKQTNKIEQID